MAKRTVDFQAQTDDIISNLDIMAEYRTLGVRFASDRPRSSGWVECYAVSRDERKPSASVNVHSGRFHDSGSNEDYSLFDFAVKYGSFRDWKEARKHFADKAGVKVGNHKPPENPAELIEFLPWTAGEEKVVEWWCRKSKPGTTVEAIKLAGGRVGRYPCKDSKGNDRTPEYKVIALPCWGERGLNSEPVAWVLWNLSGGSFRIFRGKDKPADEVKMKSVGPTRGTMMNYHALSRLSDGGEHVEWIVKTGGPSDMLTALSALPPDLHEKILILTNASSETGDVLPNQVSWLAARRAIVVHDADAAGEAGAAKWCNALSSVASEVRNAKLPWAVAPKHGNDLRDYFVGKPADGESEVHSRSWSEFWSLVESTPVYVANGNPAATNVPASSSESDHSHSSGTSPTDPFSSNPDTCREKMIVDAVKLDVLGCNRKGGVKVFSLYHRRSTVIDRVAKLQFEDLLQIAGNPAKQRIVRTREESEQSSDTFLLGEVKEAISLLGGYLSLSEGMELGMGCWPGATITGEAYPSVVLVGKGRAAEWNGDQVLNPIDHPRCRGNILDFESADEQWYDQEQLANYLQQAKSQEWREQVLYRTVELFQRWRWTHSSSPLVTAGLVFATWVQTVWDWRPQVAVVGESSSGKTMLVQALTKLFGPLAKSSSDSTSAGMRQVIQSSARIIIHDEFDLSSTSDKGRKVEHEKILKMLRSSGRGDSIIRGTSDQKGQAFVLRHIVWLMGIHLASNQEADRNRYVCLELLKKLPNSPKLAMPTTAELAEHGQKMLAVAVYCANRAKQIASKIREVKVEGVHERIVESYSVPAAMVAAIQGGGEEDAVGLLNEMLCDMSRAEREISSDVEDLLCDIFGIQMQIGSDRLSVSQMLVNIIKQDRDWDKQEEVLQSRGIKVCLFGNNKDTPEHLRGHPCLSIAHKAVSSHVLRGTRWEGQAIDMVLRRYPNAVQDRKLIGGAFLRCISMPLEQIRAELLDLAPDHNDSIPSGIPI